MDAFSLWQCTAHHYGASGKSKSIDRWQNKKLFISIHHGVPAARPARLPAKTSTTSTIPLNGEGFMKYVAETGSKTNKPGFRTWEPITSRCPATTARILFV